jgi:uncharacterized membrane protein
MTDREPGLRDFWMSLLVLALPAGWVAFRTLTAHAEIQQMCLDASWYAEARCESGPVIARAVSVVAAWLITAALVTWLQVSNSRLATWVRFRVSGDASRIRSDAATALRQIPASHLAAIALLTILAVVLRSAHMNDPMRSDENQTFLLYSGQSLLDAVWRFDTTNNHILYSALARLSIVIGGPTPAMARLPEMVFGVLLVPATAIALRRAWTPPAALVAAAVVSAMPYLIAFSTNARGYSLVMFFFLLAVPPAIRLRSHFDAVAWLALGWCAALALLTNATAIYPFGALFAWIAIARVMRRDRQGATIEVGSAGVAVGAMCWMLYGPAITAMGTEALFRNPWMAPPPWEVFASTWLVTLDGTLRELWWQWGWGIPVIATAVMFAAMILALASEVRSRWLASGLLVTSLAWSILLAISSHRLPYTRVLLPFLPLLLTAAAAGVLVIVARLTRLPGESDRAWPVIAVVLALVLSLARESAATVILTDAGRAADSRCALVSSLHASSCLFRDRSPSDRAGPHARTRAPGGHAFHA